MNGWWRIGVVLASLSGAIIGLAAWEQESHSTIYDVSGSAKANQFEDTLMRHSLVAMENQNNPELRQCAKGTAYVFSENPRGSYSISCKNKLSYTATRTLLWAGLPFVILLVIGHTIAWIYRGFRPAE